MATFTIGTPVIFERYGTVRLARGLTSITYTTARSSMTNWMFIRPRTFERLRQLDGVVDDLVDDLLR